MNSTAKLKSQLLFQEETLGSKIMFSIQSYLLMVEDKQKFQKMEPMDMKATRA